MLLLAAFRSDAILRFATDTAARLGIAVEVAIEPERAGTGGALWHARDRLDPVFLLLNGDSWLDINVLDLAVRAASQPDCDAVLALRSLADASRSGTVTVAEERITRSSARPQHPGPGIVNGGVYIVRRRLVDVLAPSCSLEADVLPRLAAEGRLGGHVYDGFFIDIGVPDSYEAAQTLVPERQRRPAAFLDRDGVLNDDLGYVGTPERFHWLPGAMAAVKRLNDEGFYVFVVTNQAGVARGFYTENDVRSLHAHMQAELRVTGAHVDDIRYCPHHPDGTVAGYAKACAWRKPGAGMIDDLLTQWPVEIADSFLVGDKDSDLEAGRRSGIESVVRFGHGSDLEMIVENRLAGLARNRSVYRVEFGATAAQEGDHGG